MKRLYLQWLNYKALRYEREAEVEARASIEADANARWFILRAIGLRSKIDRDRVTPHNNGVTS